MDKAPTTKRTTTVRPRGKALITAVASGILLCIIGISFGSDVGAAASTLLDNQQASLRLHPRDLASTELEGVQTGDITFFEPSMGSCGIQSNANEPVVAVSAALFDKYPESAAQGGNPNRNPLCGKMIRLERVHNGVPCSVDVRVVDRCVRCAESDLDVSEHAFRQVAVPEMGRVQATWSWL